MPLPTKFGSTKSNHPSAFVAPDLVGPILFDTKSMVPTILINSLKLILISGTSGALEENSIKEPQSVDVAPFLIPHLNFDEIIFHEPDPLGTSQVPVVTYELKEGDSTSMLYLL